MKERRKHKRYNSIDIVRYAPIPHFSNTFFSGVMQNHSPSGLCFITPQSLEDAQEIVLRSGATSKVKTAVVRWREDIRNGNFKVGVEFIKA